MMAKRKHVAKMFPVVLPISVGSPIMAGADRPPEAQRHLKRCPPFGSVIGHSTTGSEFLYVMAFTRRQANCNKSQSYRASLHSTAYAAT